MFKDPFSFKGRICRSEFGISYIIFMFVYYLLLMLMAFSGDLGGVLFFLFIVPAVWFMWAQAAKRCHDLGNSGWYQLIPFYGFWLLFADGQRHENEYGEDPKATKFNQPATVQVQSQAAEFNQRTQVEGFSRNQASEAPKSDDHSRFLPPTNESPGQPGGYKAGDLQ